jgi:hypothetical protein
MRVKLIPLIAAMGAVALALTMVTSGQAGKGDIFGGDHDTGTPGSPTCAQCHTPHKAEGMYLWANVPYSPYAGESEILPLCFSCHDGSVTSDGSYFVDADHNHPQGTVMYDPDHVPGTGDEFPITEHGAYETSCKKCMEPDCGKCHDAHSDAWVFLDTERFTPADHNGDTVPEDYMNASICAWCHEGRRHGVETYVLVEAVEDPEVGDACDNDVDDDGDTVVNDGCPSEYAAVPHSSHPEMITDPDGANDYTPPAGADRLWNGDSAVWGLSGTRLWSDDTTYYNVSPGDDTPFFVETSGSGDIRCMTCHTLHAGQSESLTAMAEVSETDSHSPICENCHE